MVNLKDINNKVLPRGASVFDEAGNFVTIVAKNGSVFIPNLGTASYLEVQSSGQTLCSFRIEQLEQPNDDALYETVNAVCE